MYKSNLTIRTTNGLIIYIIFMLIFFKLITIRTTNG